MLLLDRRPDDAHCASWPGFWPNAYCCARPLTSAWLVRRGLAPLHSLVEQTRQLGAQDLSRDWQKRLDDSNQPQELRPLIAQFNALLERLAVAYRQMEAFNADVAHELNTPLTTLISSCELALRKPRDAEELRDILASNLEDLQRMAGIVADMLFLSHADRGQSAHRIKSPASLVWPPRWWTTMRPPCRKPVSRSMCKAMRRPRSMPACCAARYRICWAMPRATLRRAAVSTYKSPAPIQPR